MVTKSLTGTPLESIYTLFSVANDKDLCTAMANIGLIYTCAVGLISLVMPAPYGRYQKKSFGPVINAKIGWVIQECMAFFVPVIILRITPSLQLRNFSNVIPIVLFIVHYFHRGFIYPWALPDNSNPTPVLTVLNAALFTSYNGFLQTMHLANVATVDDSMYGFIGTIVFLTGMAINMIHDRMLINLRKLSVRFRPTSDANIQSSADMVKYKIPRGGLFEYISGANYFGEIVEWIGFAVITREYPQVVFAIFTTVFLGSRAIHHHQFYKVTFEDLYPESRKAIIPFIL